MAALHPRSYEVHQQKLLKVPKQKEKFCRKMPPVTDIFLRYYIIKLLLMHKHYLNVAAGSSGKHFTKFSHVNLVFPNL